MTAPLHGLCPFIRYRALRKFCGLHVVMRIPVLKHFATSPIHGPRTCAMEAPQARDVHLVDAGDLKRSRKGIAVVLGVNNDHGVSPVITTTWKFSPCHTLRSSQ